MTAGELISILLENQDPEAEVKIHDSEGNMYSIGRVSLNKKWAEDEFCWMIEAVQNQ